MRRTCLYQLGLVLLCIVFCVVLLSQRGFVGCMLEESQLWLSLAALCEGVGEYV